MSRLTTFTRPHILHGNRFNGATILSSANITNPANMVDGITTTQAEILNTSAEIIFDAGVGLTLTGNSLGMARHNGTDFTVTADATLSWSDDDITYTPLVSNLNVAATTGPKFDWSGVAISHRYWKVEFDLNVATSFFLGDLTFGTAVELPASMPTGFISPVFNDQDDINYNKTLGGHLAGLNSKSKGKDCTIPVNYMSNTWLRTYAIPMIADLKLYPFYFLWDDLVTANQSDYFFGWLKSDVPRPKFSQKHFSSMTIVANGIT